MYIYIMSFVYSIQRDHKKIMGRKQNAWVKEKKKWSRLIIIARIEYHFIYTLITIIAGKLKSRMT